MNKLYISSLFTCKAEIECAVYKGFNGAFKINLHLPLLVGRKLA
jgi:hypothetical protein